MDRSQAIQTILAKTVILSPNVQPGTYKKVEAGYQVGTQIANGPSFSVTINGKERIVSEQDFNATYTSDQEGRCMKTSPQRVISTEHFRDEAFRSAFNSLLTDPKWTVGEQFVGTSEDQQDWSIRAVIAYSVALNDGQWSITNVYPISADSVRRNYPYDFQKIIQD